MTPFHEWVANTIQSLGGNGDEYLRGIEEQWSLTVAADRIGACQWDAQPFVGMQFADSALHATTVNANSRTLH